MIKIVQYELNDEIYNCYEITHYMLKFLPWEDDCNPCIKGSPVFYARKNVTVELGTGKFEYLKIPDDHRYELYYTKPI